jgi:hypothetical protein
MVQRFAENNESGSQPSSDVGGQYADKAKALADDASSQARNLLETVTNYIRNKPTEALMIAGGAAFVIGALYAIPRFQSKDARIARDFERRVRQAYEEARSAQESTMTWDKVMEWVSTNLARRI